MDESKSVPPVVRLEEGDGEGSSAEDELEPIEGVRAWVVVFGSFLMHAIVIGFLYSL